VTRWMGSGLVSAAVAAGLGLCAWPAVAQEGASASQPMPAEPAMERRVQVSIPSQPLLAALRAFGLQTQSQVLFPADVPGGDQRSAAVHGVYEPREALERMLAPTRVVITAARPGAFALKAVASLTRDGSGPRMQPVALHP